VRTAKLIVEVPVQNLVAACKTIQKYGTVLEIYKGPKKKKLLAHVMIKDPKLIEIARELASKASLASAAEWSSKKLRA
jgi:hypothetical protein